MDRDDQPETRVPILVDEHPLVVIVAGKRVDSVVIGSGSNGHRH
jgi:hypothetical protein